MPSTGYPRSRTVQRSDSLKHRRRGPGWKALQRYESIFFTATKFFVLDRARLVNQELPRVPSRCVNPNQSRTYRRTCPIHWVDHDSNERPKEK